MKKFKKILKWTGIALGGLIFIFVALVFLRQNRKFDAPYPNIHASKDSAVIARGEYLAFGPAHCSGCHSPEANQEQISKGEILPLSGGLPFSLPIGNIYSRNITPDEETGIGKLPDSVIARSLRYGVGYDGRAIFDFMPFHNLSDEDLTAVISFLRSQPPVKNKVPAAHFNFLGKAVRAFLIKPIGPDGEVTKVVKPDTTAAYGKYLTFYIANCRGCHTNRSLMTGAYTGPFFAGGLKLESDDGSYCVTPNLTPDKETGRIYGWTEDQFIHRFRQPRVIASSPMPWEQFRNITDNDLKAIYKYLTSLDPIKRDNGPTYVAAKKK
ncbi:MAG TPA: cytochrome c [Chitinophagaceae bacterium]|nr:cytochrome c [Chitinophagaceae bacterium]